MADQKGHDYGDFMLIFFLILVAAAMFFSKYLFYYYLYAWKAINIPVVFLIKSMPDFLAEIVFFWAPAGVTDMASKIFQIIINKPNAYFVNNNESYKLINKYVGLWLKPYVIMVFLYGIFIILTKKNFNRIYLKGKAENSPTSIDMLLQQEAKIWPSIKIMVNEHPEYEGNLDKGKWAMPMRPEKFVKEFNLVDHFTNEYDEKYFRLNEERTFKVLNKQMGKPWTNFESLTKIERQLFAIIAPKLLRNPNETKKIISSLASYYTTEKLGIIANFKHKMEQRKTAKAVDEIIEKYKNNDAIKAIINKHFYKKTAFAALLEAARQDGVLATSEFIWLKVYDRELWYMINNVGRKASFVECAAPWCHFLAEKSLDRKIANPMIANAIIALDENLYETHYEYQRIHIPEESDGKE